MSYRPLEAFQGLFQGKRYIHRDASRGDFVAIHLYEDLYTVAQFAAAPARPSASASSA